MNFPLHRLAGLFTFTIYSGKEEEDEKRKNFPSQSFNEFNAGNSTPATVDTRFFIVYDRFCAVEWMGPPMNALSASRDVLQRTLRILTQMTRGRGACKRAAQVSSLLEAVFNRSPWNYAAYNAYTVSANFEAFLPLLPPSRRRRRFVKAQQILLVFHFRSMEKISSRDNYYRYYSDNHRSIAISFDANSIVHTVYIHDRSVKLRSGGF